MHALTLSYTAALGSMKEAGPKPLLKRAELEVGDLESGTDVSLKTLVSFLEHASLNDPLRKRFHLCLAEWDSAEWDPNWAEGTSPRTRDRRESIYQALRLDESTSEAFQHLFPVLSNNLIVISEEFEPWYSPERRSKNEFYWPAYSDYLTKVKDWHPDAIASLDRASSAVVERLSDPMREQAHQAKGLVVGYVQSGKTANFTGVLAKAIDAGYRLLIVLTGTVDLLREQTQRRIDMELAGEENILRGVDPEDSEVVQHVDYQDDPDWMAGNFVKHGFLPSDQGIPDIIRLTTHRFDYKSLKAGITALEFEKAVKMLPFYAEENLPTSSARLVIVKKNKSVLQKLVKDLKSITARLGEIPTLIIDDESDQASVNTTNPRKWLSERPTRTAINQLISNLLELLPRAQYVGYTATPFANVFVDPSDTEDIFPKDFLLSLDRPPGYMGIRDFHDIDSELDPEERTVGNSREKAHVRSLYGETDEKESDELLEALDAYVISGAVKLYRERNGLNPGFFKHHTMLVHQSVRIADHALLAEKIKNLWTQAAYSSPTGMARLRQSYESDFLEVCRARAVESFPEDFNDLKLHIGEVVTRTTSINGNPVIIVNGDKDLAQEPIDFDRRSVWRILVGGTKLSRGFTVEGLTISYYRRKTKQEDTLMQMGRWFGFREGYEDLVRLFIGRSEKEGKGSVDLYQAFEAVVRDEELFREQLKKYSVLVDGKPQVTPAQIPPLVSQHLAWLRPAAANKMFNAQLALRRSPGTPIEPTAFPKSPVDLKWNYEQFRGILGVADQSVALQIPSEATKATKFEAFVGITPHDSFLGVVANLRWFVKDHFDADLAFLRELSGQVDDWLVICPQTGRRGATRILPDIGMRSVFFRTRTRDPLFQAISDPKHRPPALRIARSKAGYGDPVIEQFVADRRGAILIYPVVEVELHPKVLDEELEPSAVVMAFTLVAPADSTQSGAKLVKFVARNKADQQAIVVDI
jgi:hypothetical protein